MTQPVTAISATDVSLLAARLSQAWWAARLIYVFAFSQFMVAYVVLAINTDYETTPFWLVLQVMMLFGLVLGWSLVGAPIRPLRWPILVLLVLFAALMVFDAISGVVYPEVIQNWSQRFPDPRFHQMALTFGPYGPVIVYLAWTVPFALIMTAGAVAGLSLRFGVIDGFGATLLALDQRVRTVIAKSADAPGLASLVRWSRWQGWLVGGAALCVLMLPALLPGREGVIPKAEGPGGWIADILARLITFANDRVLALSLAGLVALALWRLSRRLLSPEARFVLKSQARPPILLLRSFKDEGAAVSPTELWRGALRLVRLGPPRRLEEVAAQSLAPIGPFIAVGDPKERLPPLGAFRAQLKDDEWQPQVCQWMKDARVIVLIAGTTRWVTWELETAAQVGVLDKVLILVPPGTAQDRKRRFDHMATSLAATPWAERLKAIDPASVLAARFVSDGGVRLITARGRGEVDYDLAIRLGISLIIA